MPITSLAAGITPLQRSGLDDLVPLYSKDIVPQYKKFTAAIPDNKQAFYRVLQYGDLPAATGVNAATGITTVSPFVPYSVDVNFTKYGIGIAFASEVEDRDYYGIIDKFAKMLAQSAAYAMEGDMAGFLNFGFSGGTTVLTTPDAVAIFSASHPYNAGGLDSTLVSGAPNLGIFSLEQAYAAVLRQHTYAGEPWQYGGKFKLVVGPENFYLAQRLAGAKNLPQGNDNDPNVAGGMISEVVVCQRLTSTTAWFLIPASDDDLPFKRIVQRENRIRNDNPAQKDTEEYYLTSIWTKFAEKYQGLMASAGS